jgi:DNA mismatch endonuclease, patch repair protein
MNMDHKTSIEASQRMRAVRRSHTAPEMVVRRLAHKLGLRFRLHRKELPGSPDLVFPRHRLIIFVHGCFWHRHRGCTKSTFPKTRQEFWNDKFIANIERDAKNELLLRQQGWRVEVVWECETKDIAVLTARLLRIFAREGGKAQVEE